MDATFGAATGSRDGPLIAQRMNDILRDEIHAGALANIVSATRAWSAHRRDLVLPEATRALGKEFGGLLGAVLDLVAPTSRPANDAPVSPTPRIQPRPRAEQPLGSVPVLRARRPAARGGRAEIRTAVMNDGPTKVQIGFLWSDLVAEPRGCIAASCLRLRPPWLEVAPGAAADLAIDLHIPRDAEPGLYHSLLRTTADDGAPALLIFRVAGQDNPEVAISM